MGVGVRVGVRPKEHMTEGERQREKGVGGREKGKGDTVVIVMVKLSQCYVKFFCFVDSCWLFCCPIFQSLAVAGLSREADDVQENQLLH